MSRILLFIFIKILLTGMNHLGIFTTILLIGHLSICSVSLTFQRELLKVLLTDKTKINCIKTN